MHDIQSVEVFTLSTKSMDSEDRAHVCLLDKSALLDKTINARFDRLAVKAWWPTFKADYEQAFACELKARQYQLAYLPAIVINGRAVIYGVTSVSKALALWEKAHD